MENFEEKLQKLEKLTQDIKRPTISLEEALKDFEEGIKLAKGMESELDKIEGKIQRLMNGTGSSDDSISQTGPELDLFSGFNADGTSDAPIEGTRQ